MARKTLSRPVLITIIAVLVVGVLAAAFWPRATIVDMGEVTKGPMMVTIDEEGHTRVREAFVVSSPVAGRLERIELHPGDAVKRNATVVASMRPANPAALDVRTREQALAALKAAEAALKVAKADLQATIADVELAESDLARTEQLAASGTVSTVALDRAKSAARAAEARRRTAEAAIAQRRAELQSAQAQLIGFDDKGLLAALEQQLGEDIPIYAPSDGVILQVFQQDETTVTAGAPILEIGDIGQDLEVVVELISSDAVQVSVGDPVIIDDWGGPDALAGSVMRIEPYGETKVSALGVEEQRVTVVVQLDTPPDQRQGLGHGYRVEARIVIWQAEDTVIVPSSALFREGADWAVFKVNGGEAHLQTVSVGHDNGTQAEVIEGLAMGDSVVLYPPATLGDRASVARRKIEGN